ncbi:MAG: ribbon-helix-helix protein, CopG family [Candidatus Obscuribacterales bacterium]
MRLPQICVRFPTEMAEEVSRLAKANRLTDSEMVRELVRDGIIVRAEATTNSQFAYVEKRLRLLAG